MAEPKQYRIKLEQFQGPLDLLLRLILEEKLDITEISLAKVTEQFIEYLTQVEELRPEELADFLVVATKLLLIKSRAMLPYLNWEEVEEESNLTEQLKLYQEFYHAAEKLAQRLSAKQYSFGRVDNYFSHPEPVFNPPPRLTAQGLQDYFKDALLKLEPIVRLPQAALARTISLKEKIAHLQDHLVDKVQMNFKDLISQSQDRGEVIVTFLALLELIKKQVVCVKQAEYHADIMIEKI